MSEFWDKELQAKIIFRAWKDENFKNQLLSNPKEAFKEFGVELPDNIDVDVVTEKANHFYFVLPETPSNVNNLSDAELTNIAGGYTICITVCMGTVGCD